MKIRIESSDGMTGYAEAEILAIGFGITVDTICKQYDEADIYVKVLEQFKLEQGKPTNIVWIKPSKTSEPINSTQSQLECGNHLSCGRDWTHVCRLPRGHEGDCVCDWCSTHPKKPAKATKGGK